MTWSSGFKNALKRQSIAPSYRLLMRNLYMDSAIEIRSSGSIVSIGRDGPTISGQRVIPGSWNISFGSFTVPIVGNIASLFPTIRKGVFAELFCSISGQEERIAAGQLRTIKKSYTKFIFEFVDLVASLGTNFDLSPNAGTEADPDPFSLFYSAGIPVQVRTDWVTGGGGLFPTQLDVYDTRPFVKENGQVGVIRCVPSSGNDFILRWNSVTTTGPGNQGYLTLAHNYNPLLDPIYPSVYKPTALTTANYVYSAQYLKGWPGDIFAKLMISTSGTGTGFNTYPPKMNSGSKLSSSFYDYMDSVSWKSIIKGSPTLGVAYDVGYVVTEPISSGWRGLINIFAQAGHWPVFRQNSLSYRGCSDPGQNVNLNVVASITDRDIFSLVNHDLFSPDQRATYYRQKINFANKEGVISTLTATLQSTIATSRPIQSTKTRDNSGLYGPDPWTSINDRLSLGEGDGLRMRIWDLCNYEKLTIEVRICFAVLCCGDIVEIESGILYGINESGDNKTYKRRAMVIGVDYSISSSRCSLTLAIPFYDSLV